MTNITITRFYTRLTTDQGERLEKPENSVDVVFQRDTHTRVFLCYDNTRVIYTYLYIIGVERVLDR